MATKRLERTVIEGGRTRYSKQRRRASNKSARRKRRMQDRRWEKDPSCYAAETSTRRAGVYKDFWDKLGPAERWLAKQAGRPWADVRSEIAQKFDTRSLAGRHIVYDHLLPAWWSGHGPWRVHRRAWFEIDGDGVLQVTWGRHYLRRRVDYVRPETVAWFDLRKVALRGERYYWLMPTRELTWWRKPEDLRRRQGKALTDDEARRVRQLTPAEREAFVVVYE